MTDLTKMSARQNYYTKLSEYTHKLSQADNILSDMLADYSNSPVPVSMDYISELLRQYRETVREVHKSMQVEKATLEKHRPERKEQQTHLKHLNEYTSKLSLSGHYVDALIDECDTHPEPISLLQLGLQLRHHGDVVREITKTMNIEKVALETRHPALTQQTFDRQSALTQDTKKPDISY